MTPVRSGSGLAVTVGIAGVILSALLAIRVLAEYDWDPTIFVSFGEEHVEITEYGESVLGREVVTRPALGHDGKYFFVQANDPWLLDPDQNIQVIDRPIYRAQRMLYPMLAGGFGLLAPSVVVWTMVVVNLLAMGVGSWGVARVAEDMGGSAWWGLAFALNLGFISEQLIDGAGVVAAAAAFLAVWLLIRHRNGAAVALFVVAALAREAMLVAVLGAALWLWWSKRRREAIWIALIPGLAVTLWGIYARLRIGFDSGVSQVQEIGLPFVGIARAARLWLNDPIDLAVGIVILLLLALYTRRVLMGRQLVGWAFVGFVPLALVFTRQVWLNYFDITRAVAPIITSFVLLVFLSDVTRRAVAIPTVGQTVEPPDDESVHPE